MYIPLLPIAHQEKKNTRIKVNSSKKYSYALKNQSSPTIDFQSVFNAEKEKLNNANYQEMLQQIDQAGERLEQNTSIHNYHAYKKSIQTFFQLAIPQTYQVHTFQENINLKNLEQKSFTILGQVNQELANILHLLQQREQNKLHLLSQISRVKGLLLDLRQ